MLLATPAILPAVVPAVVGAQAALCIQAPLCINDRGTWWGRELGG
jgi:hypothetical protein